MGDRPTRTAGRARLADGCNARIVTVGLVGLLALLLGCTNADVLPVLEVEPVLEQPPGAVELARTLTDGSTVGFETPARVETVWGVDDVDATADWYLDTVGEIYDLDLNDTAEWLGGRRVDDVRVNVAVRAWQGLDEVRWDTLVAERDDVAEWPGPVVVARASSG